ncbi:MAG: hypothetical protein KL863_13670 [Rhizobium sp.]|nr:hypothetical protein [Rhizobium sp.]
MIALVFYVWLLGTTLIFVGAATTGEASDRFEGLWLLALSATWPLVMVLFVLGAVAAMAGMLISNRR